MQCFFLRTTAIRLHGCRSWFEFSMGAHSYTFSHVAAHMSAWLKLQCSETQLALTEIQIPYLPWTYRHLNYTIRVLTFKQVHLRSYNLLICLQTTMSGKQYIFWSFAALRGVWSGSTLFAQAFLNGPSAVQPVVFALASDCHIVLYLFYCTFVIIYVFTVTFHWWAGGHYADQTCICNFELHQNKGRGFDQVRLL